MTYSPEHKYHQKSRKEGIRKAKKRSRKIRKEAQFVTKELKPFRQKDR